MLSPKKIAQSAIGTRSPTVKKTSTSIYAPKLTAKSQEITNTEFETPERSEIHTPDVPILKPEPPPVMRTRARPINEQSSILKKFASIASELFLIEELTILPQ